MLARRLLALALLPLALLIAIQVLAQWRDGWFAMDDRFIGPDAYMRTVRVLDLLDSGDWFDNVIERSNAPRGEVLHWTRPLDVLILAGAAPLTAIAGLNWRDAVYLSGTLVSPLLHILALFAFLWALRPLLDERGLLLAGILFAAQFYLAFQFAIGRPDHHGLILLLDIVLLGLALRLIGPGARMTQALAAGGLAALVIWVSVEGLAIAALLLSALAADWVLRGRETVARGWAVAASLGLGLAIALLLERPPGDWGNISHDRLSLLHLGYAGLALLAWSLAYIWPAAWQRPALRGSALLAGLAIGGGALALYVQRYGLPAMLAGPMAEVHPRVVAEWYRFNKEVSPLLDPGDLAATLPKFIAHLGMAAISLPAMVLAIQRRRGHLRACWLLLLTAALIALALALREVRWSGLAQVFLLPGYALAAAWLIAALSRTPLRLTARTLVPVLFAVSFLVLGALLRRAESDAAPATADCDLKAMAEALNEAYPDRPRRIASFIFYGPELLYRTPHAVIATPYHRNAAGMLDVIDLLGADDMTRARAIAARRGIDLIVICHGNSEADKYRRDGARPSLLTRLERGDGPGWIGPPRPLALPGGRASAFEASP